MKTIKNIKLTHKELANILMFMLSFVIPALTAGCMANYGKYRPSSEVDKMFESRQLPKDLTYY